MLRGLGELLEQAACTAHPRGPDRPVATLGGMGAEHQGRQCGLRWRPFAEVAAVRPLIGSDRLVDPAQPPCAIRDREQVVGPETVGLVDPPERGQSARSTVPKHLDPLGFGHVQATLDAVELP